MVSRDSVVFKDFMVSKVLTVFTVFPSILKNMAEATARDMDIEATARDTDTEAQAKDTDTEAQARDSALEA